MQIPPSPASPGPSASGKAPRSDPAGPADPAGDVDAPKLSVAAAARRLGIAPATLRTWDRRYGIGPTDHTPGQHRRYSADDVRRLELMQHALVRGATPADAAVFALAARLPDPAAVPAAPVAPADAGAAPDVRMETAPADAAGQIRAGGQVLRLPGAGPRARGLGRAAVALDARAARAVLIDAIARTGIQATWDEVARPVLAAVAQRWAATGVGIEIEHMLSECVIGVFGAVGDTFPDGDARPVLLAGMPGELHTLPMVVLAATLAESGVPCRSLGPDLPAAALGAAMRRTAPVAVVLWSQVSLTADPEILRALPNTRPRARTFAAGPGWAGVEMPPRVVWLDSLGQATEMISAAVTV